VTVSPFSKVPTFQVITPFLTLELQLAPFSLVQVIEFLTNLVPFGILSVILTPVALPIPSNEPSALLLVTEIV